MSEETTGWEVWQQRDGNIVAVRRSGKQWQIGGLWWWHEDGSVLGNGEQHPRDLVTLLGMAGNQPDQSAEIETLRTELRKTWNEWSNATSALADQAAEIERLKAELTAERVDSHRQLRRLQAAHNRVTQNLQAEQRGEREGFRIAISMILEALT